MDHVSHLGIMCDEIHRVLAPNGTLIGSFNLDEPPTFSEPQTLSEDSLHRALLRHFDIQSYRTAAPGPEGDTYKHFFDGSNPPSSGRRYLWVRARKRQ
jgi:hypothetical protein